MKDRKLGWDELSTGTVRDKTFCSHAGGSCNALAKLYKENEKLTKALENIKEELSDDETLGYHRFAIDCINEVLK